MKMFLSVFFGAFCAIMAAAAVLYCNKEYQDGESARQILRETATASQQVNTTYGSIPAANQPETAPIDRVEPNNDPTLVQPVSVKTVDGEITIPAGKIVHILNEKSARGTVVVNYEGYTFAIPVSAIASGSR